MRSPLLFLGFLVLSVSFALAQDPGAVGERMKIDSINQRIRMQKVPGKDGDLSANSPRKVNLVEVRQKTDELNALVKSLNGDMASLSEGKIAADVSQRLKRIEKLAKELRQSLQ